MHPEQKCDHDKNRKKVCAPCGKKIVFQNKPPQNFALTENHITAIKNHINKEFDISNMKFPSSICVSCRLTLGELQKGISKRPLPIMPNYEDVQLAKETRTMICNCYVCLTSRQTSHSKIKKGRGHIRLFATKIDINNGLDGTQQNASLPKTDEESKKNRTTMEMCSKCFQKIGKGIPHTACSGPSSSKTRENVSDIVEQLPEKQQNQIITNLLKRRFTASDRNDGELLLNTSGSKCRIIVNAKKGNEISISAQSLDNFQANTASSTNYMKKLANFIRCSAGRNSIPKNYNQHLYDKSNIMENVYKEEVYQFETVKEGTKERPVVYANAAELLDFIIEKRNIRHAEEAKIKVMADGGQDFFKMSISILTQEEEECDSEEYKTKKVTYYFSGGSVANKRKENSVYRLILLCIVPRIKETYENVETLVKLTKVNEIPFKFSSDFKLILIVNGQQTATATYPCPYCFITLHEMHSFDLTTNNNELNTDDENQNLKTYKHLKDDYLKFKSVGNKKILAKECHNTVHHPLFVEEDTEEDNDMYVIQKCVPPELHLLQGFVNHLFWNGLVKIEGIGLEKALLWPKKLGIHHKSYQGDIFEGNQCRKLLKEGDKLQDPEIYELVGPFRLQPYIVSFKVMNKIVETCFSTKQADLSDLDENIHELREALKGTGVSQTVKIHVILDHLKQAIILLNNDGLGLWSEQAGESVHREFLKFWDRFKINNLDDVQSYSKRLKRSVVAFSSQHI